MFKLALHHPFEKQVLAVLASPFLEVHKLNNKKMKNYVVGILSMFENDLKLFKITAENDIGFNQQRPPEGMKSHCKKSEQKFKSWYDR